MSSLTITSFTKAEDTPTFLPPKSYPESRYISVWKKSPFELEAAPEKVISRTTEQPTDYTLAGVMKKGENYIVYLRNKKTQQVTKATSTPSTDGIVLKKVTPGDTAGDFVAEVEHNGRLLTLSYDRASAASAAPPKSPTSQSSTVGPTSKGKPPQADFNPAKVALERARQAAASRATQNSSVAGKGKNESSNSSRKRTIFVPK